MDRGKGLHEVSVISFFFHMKEFHRIPYCIPIPGGNFFHRKHSYRNILHWIPCYKTEGNMGLQSTDFPLAFLLVYLYI